MPRRYSEHLPLTPGVDSPYKAWGMLQQWERDAWIGFFTTPSPIDGCPPANDFKRPVDLFAYIHAISDILYGDGWMHTPHPALVWRNDHERSNRRWLRKVKRYRPLPPSGYVDELHPPTI
jgi:hypothetical protein